MALADTISSIEKTLGYKGVIVDLESKIDQEVPVIPTGNAMIDAITGIGGFPRGRIIEISGGEGAGKSGLSLQVGANAQKQGGTVLLLDFEQSFDIGYATQLGLDLSKDKLLLSQPNTIEDGGEIIRKFIEGQLVDVIIWDSVAAAPTKEDLEGDIGDAQIGIQARKMSQMLKQISKPIEQSNTCLIFVNQLRSKIGRMGGYDTTPGGRALKFYSALRLTVKIIGKIKGTVSNFITGKDEEGVVGHRVSIKVEKNKLAVPYKECEMDFVFGRGFDQYSSLLEIAAAKGVIEVGGGGNYEIFGEKLRGKPTVIERLQKDSALFEKLMEACKIDRGIPEKSND